MPKLTRVIIAALFAFAPPLVAQHLSKNTDDVVLKNFMDPPNSAKPRVWWHWLSGNVTKEGITADLEWMNRVNIGGFQMFDGDLGVPVFVDHPLTWMTPDWKDAWKHAASEADRLNLEMAMAASGGWSETAGPWVKPEQGMKKYVWSETKVAGGVHIHTVLMQPPSNSGKFLNMQANTGISLPTENDLPGAKPQPPTSAPAPAPNYYKDVAVVAFRTPSAEVPFTDWHPKFSASDGSTFSDSILTDGDLNKKISIHYGPDHQAWLQIEFDKPYPAKAFMLAMGPMMAFSGEGLPEGDLLVSGDGNTWNSILSLPGVQEPGSAGFAIRTYTLPANTNARFYRLVVKEQPPNMFTELIGGPKQEQLFTPAEVMLSSTPRVNNWEDKASFGILVDEPDTYTPHLDSGAVSPKDVVDLTSMMGTDGTLDWDAPAGSWTVLRFGYSPTGEVNHPATPAATGLEVDKLNAADVTDYMEHYTKLISDMGGEFYGKSFRYFLMDSWEAGQENWTENMMAEFRKRRGYEMISYLPVFTGRIVGSAEASDGFLWDVRKTQAEMLANNHYKLADDVLGKQKIGLYAEAMGIGTPTTGDGLLNKGQVTIPMGEFWTPLPGHKDEPDRSSDVLEAASAAHIYGKPIVATESFTSMPMPTAWGQSPFYLKVLADEHFAMGVNRIVFHTSDQQPFVDDKHRPGITLGFFGQHYTRNITWAEQAKSWNTYLARCSYMLQQGKPVQDVAIFYGEGAPASVPNIFILEPKIPSHYSFDFVNADVLLHGATVKDGRIVLASGASYRILVVPANTKRLSLAMLKKFDQLVSQGGLIMSPIPDGSPSLEDGINSDADVKLFSSKLWGLGKGKILLPGDIEAELKKVGLPEDVAFSVQKRGPISTMHEMPLGDRDEDIVFAHRHAADRDIYFVSTQKSQSLDVNLTLRVSGLEPQLWNALTGEIRPVSYTVASGRTTVPLHLDPAGSAFIIFHGAAKNRGLQLKQPILHSVMTLQGPWNVSFPPNLGAPPEKSFGKLFLWNQDSDPGVKYFSGTATYSSQFEILDTLLKPNKPMWLDLGSVYEMASVYVNGKPVPELLWTEPYRVNIRQWVKPGVNTIKIEVTNLWPNRMIGDLQPGVTTPYTFTDFRPFKANHPLLPSGMKGPVQLLVDVNSLRE